MNAPLAAPPPRFTQGSTMRHVIEMTMTGAIGLMAIFVVDFLSLFYISLLRNDELTAGVGYATTVLFLAISVNIGTMIAGAALVSRAIGAGERDAARRLSGSALALGMLVALLVSAGLLVALDPVLAALGAKGTPSTVAARFLAITLPANALMAAGMMLSALLRAVGDARRAMLVTLIGGLVTAITDPLLIFGLGLGTDGAAIATVISRLVFTAVGLNGVLRVHRLLRWAHPAEIRGDARPFAAIAVPAVLTNVASPVGLLFFVGILAPFGAEAITASTIIDRLVPVAFGVLFALSGAVGPILGQNLGARRFDRLRAALRDALLFAMGYSVLAWLALALFRHPIAALFGVEGETARYLAYFCLVGGFGWIFNGLLFVANAAFNNLGFPLYATVFNWGRATLGTIPLSMAGAALAGVEGAAAGMTLGSVIFGLAAAFVAFRAIRRIETRITAAG
ncbi:MATE family efflux transporter [Rhabdaerophilum calidifontis]|uniref:MATE family efflux transporter n=1 Tax=Rhabdaerophilum calidifontis TaxID=2604328 RepID=UPI00123ACF3F|nr:MATE family efflux transporter [Rhabdaerophilum calidifontis]